MSTQLLLVLALIASSPAARAEGHDHAPEPARPPAERSDRYSRYDKPDTGKPFTLPPPPMSPTRVIESKVWLAPCQNLPFGGSVRLRVRFQGRQLIMETVGFKERSCVGPVGVEEHMRVDYGITESPDGKILVTVPDTTTGKIKIIHCDFGPGGKLTMTDGYFNLSLVAQ